MKTHRWKVVGLIAIVAVAAISAAGYKFTHQHPVTQQHLQGPFRVRQQNAHVVLKEIDVDPQCEFHREFVAWAQQLHGAPSIVTYAPIGIQIGSDDVYVLLGEIGVVFSVGSNSGGISTQFHRYTNTADRVMLEKAKTLLAESAKLEPSNTEH